MQNTKNIFEKLKQIKENTEEIIHILNGTPETAEESRIPTAKTAAGAYGVEWDSSAGGSRLKRTGLAEMFDDPVPAVSVTGYGRSPFDKVMPWAGMKKYNIINGEVAYSEESWDFDMEDYDTVVYIPEFYYTTYKDPESKKQVWAVSPTKLEGYARHPGSGRYVGRYHTTGNDGEVHSRSGEEPLTRKSQTEFRTCSKNKGPGWYMLDIASWAAIQMLYLVEFADFDSQMMLGRGWIAGSAGTTGGTDLAEYHTIKASGTHNQYRWIENPFSNVFTWIDGFTGSTEEVYVGVNNDGFAEETEGLEKTGAKLADDGYIKGFSDAVPWAFIPDDSDYGNAAQVPDYANSGSSLRPASVGGSYNSDVYYGLFYFSASNTASYSYGNLGSRLLFTS